MISYVSVGKFSAIGEYDIGRTGWYVHILIRFVADFYFPRKFTHQIAILGCHRNGMPILSLIYEHASIFNVSIGEVNLAFAVQPENNHIRPVHTTFKYLFVYIETSLLYKESFILIVYKYHWGLGRNQPNR
jgi:hypothetical protein